MFPVYNIKVVDKPGRAFGSIEYILTKPILDDKFTHNLNYDEEVNRLLDEVEEEFLWDKPENYDFPEDTHHVGSIPNWYRDMLKSKIKEAKSRLENLSNLVCATSPSTAAHIKRIEEDHSTAFCKMDYPRHPPMHKSWRSTWELRYAKKCKETDSNHTHLAKCKRLVVVDFETGMRMDTPNISQHDYPPHVIRVARLFRNFAKKLWENKSKFESKEKLECKEKSKCEENVNTIEDDWWTTMTMVLISNHLNELMIVVRREKVSRLIPYLKTYFERVIRKNPNIVSVLGFNTAKMSARQRQAWINTVDKNNITKKLLIAGTPVLKDKIGPLSMQYDLANHLLFFDSVETMQLGKVIQDYMCLTKETTLLDFGCNLGVLSLIMAYKCEKVIGLNVGPRAKRLIHLAEKLKQANKIHNVSFVEYNAENIITTCAPLVEQCITVAILKLTHIRPYLGVFDIMKALRNLPSIWRVIVYGPFTDELHESIEVLTSEDDSMGERYLPMQGCILDKSPTVDNAFDLVILFERKSLIAPKIELFAPGPTVNVAIDSEMCDNGSLDSEEVKLELSSDGDQELENSKEKSEERLLLPAVREKRPQSSADNQFIPSNPSRSVRKEFQCISSPPSTETFSVPSLSEKEEFRFDYPPPPLGRFPSFSHPPSSANEEFQFNFPPPPFQGIPPFHPNASGPAREHFQNDYPPSLLESRFPNPHFHPDSYPPMREDFRFNCSHPFLERYSNAPIFQGPYPPIRDDFQDHYYPLLPPESYYNPPHFPDPHASVGNEFQNHCPSPPPPVSPVRPQPSRPTKKKPRFYYPPPPPTRFPSPPPPPPLPPSEETNLLEKDSSTSSSSTTVIDVSVQTCEKEKVNQIVNAAEDVISSVVIKSEPIDPNYSADISEANCTLSDEKCYLPMTTVKDKSEQVCEKKASEIVNTAENVISNVAIKSEPIDPCYSANLLEANRYSPTTTVKAEPLQNKEKKDSNVTDCGTTVKDEPLQNEEKKESNVADCGTTVKAEPLQNEEKKDSNVADCGTTVKAEPLQDEVKNELNLADCGTSSVPIKSEPTNQSSSVNISDTNCKDTALPVVIESEPTNFSPITSPDCEPMDMQISPSPPEFQSMKTPIHNPRALSDITPLTVSKNVSVNGSEFPLQTNQSFLGKVKPKVAINVDRELVEISDSDGENEAIGEEKNKQQNKPKTLRVEMKFERELPKKHVSTIPPLPRRFVPLPLAYQRRNARSPSPKRFRRSPTPDARRRRRSPVSDRRRERSRRTPLVKKRETYGRAKSPRDRRKRRSRSRSPRRR